MLTPEKIHEMYTELHDTLSPGLRLSEFKFEDYDSAHQQLLRRVKRLLALETSAELAQILAKVSDTDPGE